MVAFFIKVKDFVCSLLNNRGSLVEEEKGFVLFTTKVNKEDKQALSLKLDIPE